MVSSLDSRYGTSASFMERAKDLTGHAPITSIPAAEPIGPKGLMDILVIAPCTGNTLSKLANGISDTPVLMAAKSHLRNNRPLVISLNRFLWICHENHKSCSVILSIVLPMSSPAVMGEKRPGMPGSR